jgi:acyl-CoA thioesterase-1
MVRRLAPNDGDRTTSVQRTLSDAAHSTGVLALMALSLVACASGNPENPGRRTPLRILVLGDSLSVSPTVAESFPSLLQQRLTERGSPATVINAGVRGDTTAGGVARIDALLAQKPDLLILALGANDGLRGLQVEAMSRNLGEIIQRSKQRGVEVLLCGMELPPVRGISYARAFRAVFPDLARAYEIRLVPFLLDGVALNSSMNGADQIHPNAAGARKIADTVWGYLEPLLESRNK